MTTNENETIDDYHMDRGYISSSEIKCFDQGASMYEYRYIRGNKAYSKSFALGSLVHGLSLEPDIVSDEYVICPIKDRRTKAYKEWFNDSDKTKKVVMQSEWDTALDCTNALYEHKIAESILTESGPVECSYRFRWNDIPCKFRPDKIIPSAHIVADIKTCQECTPSKVYQAVRNFSYGLQAAHYLTGAEIEFEDWFDFIFLFVETKPPHRVLCYRVDVNSIETLKDRWGLLVTELYQRKRTDDWTDENNNNLLTLEI